MSWLVKALCLVLGSSSHSPETSCKVGLHLGWFQACGGQMPPLHPEAVVGWPGWVQKCPHPQAGWVRVWAAAVPELARRGQIATLDGAWPMQLHHFMYLLEVIMHEQE